MSDLNRRNLLAALPLFAIGRSVRAQENGEPIGTGFIGTGNRGAYLLQNVIKLPGAKVVALCDIKPDRLDKAATAAARDNPATMTDYRRLLERKDVQAVFIASPCDLHVEMAIAALRAGKHVYCEKPLGITPQSIRELLKVAKSSKTVFQVGQQMRSIERLRKTIEKVHEGSFGKVIMVKAQRHAGDDLDHNGPSADWFFNAKRSGDVLVEMAVHNLDVCNWVIGSRPERAAGFGGALLWANDPPGRTNMDGYTLSYDYPNGVKLSFIQNFFHPDGMPNGGQFWHVYTTEGAVDLSNSTFYARREGAKPVVLVEPVAERGDAHMAAFYESIRTGKKPPADIVVGATGALTAILGREAIYRKQVMTWADFGVDV
ncbi:MAG: Gfo/Idh/MocA family protein [Acidobacteriota bacterium]